MSRCHALVAVALVHNGLQTGPQAVLAAKVCAEQFVLFHVCPNGVQVAFA
jgi:hypothetical protein